MNKDIFQVVIERDIDYILKGKGSISKNDKKIIVSIIVPKITNYSHKVINGKIGFTGTGLFGHVTRKSLRVDYLTHMREYLNLQVKEINSQSFKSVNKKTGDIING